jgi:RNA polymerase sigma factor for flagellar operon FliA
MLIEDTEQAWGSSGRPVPEHDHAVYRRYSPLVRRIAMKTVRRMPAEISLDDLIGAGWIGLAEALGRRGSCNSEEHFEAYASYRIRGAILDYLRSLDPMSRKLRGASREITSAIKALTSRFGRAPDEDEIAVEMGLDLEAYQDLLGQVAQAAPARVDIAELTTIRSSPEAAPDSLLSRRQMVDCLAAAIERLPERLQLVLDLHYQEECSLKEIGAVLGVTESRACQLHSEAVHRIRAEMERSFEATQGSTSSQLRKVQP